MLILGIMLLIGLFVPYGGSLTDLIRNIFAPWFGTMRWLLPFVLLLLGYYLYRAQSDNSDWELTLLGSAVSYLSLLGVVGLLTAHDTIPRGGSTGQARRALHQRPVSTGAETARRLEARVRR